MKAFIDSRIRVAAMIAVALCFAAASAVAQDRMSDKDVETTMNNIRQDSKKFGAVFNSALKKSTFRKTDKEKSARTMVKLFESRTTGMLNEFKRTKKADNSLPLVLDSGNKIESFLRDNPLGDQVTSAWTPVRGELDSLSKAFNMTAPAN